MAPNCRFFAILTLFLLMSCSQPTPSIKIGAVLPLSGTFSVYGQQALKGAQLAVEQINQNGGVLGRPLELVVKDNETDPAKTVKYSRELVHLEDVYALLGPVSSSSRYAMSEIAEEYKIPMLYGIDYEGRHYSDYLICYSTIPEHYIEPIVPKLMPSFKNYYIFGYDYIWPHRMTEHIIDNVEQYNGTIAGVEFTPFGIQDYSQVLQRIERSGTDVLMLILPGSDGFHFLKQFKQYPFNRKIQIIAFAADETYLEHLSPNELEGVMTALHFFSSLDNSVAKKFVQEYRQFHGQESVATYSSKAHYDLVMLLKLALERAGQADKTQIMANLEDLRLYSGPNQIHLRNDHHFDLPMFLGQFLDGELTVIDKLGTIRPEDQRIANP